MNAFNKDNDEVYLRFIRDRRLDEIMIRVSSGTDAGASRLLI